MISSSGVFAPSSFQSNSASALRRSDDEQLEGAPDLLRGEPDAVRLVHGLDHLVGERGEVRRRTR